MYREDQSWFLNCVVVAETDVEPATLLRWLKRIEVRMGRDPHAARNAPRVIDMDLLFYGDRVITGPGLEVPHPGIAERAFVLVPLSEVRPHLVHPALGKSVEELLKDLQTRKGVVMRADVSLGISPSPPQRPGRPAASP
jgi:7,8-dihydro-6-hydroxymethylpterin-pyrophosphokinase